MVADAARLSSPSGPRARRHQCPLACLALGLLVLIAEIVGRSLTHRLDLGRHVGRVSYAQAEYYPFLLAAVKVGAALMLARIAWRFAKARAAERTAARIAAAVGVRLHRPAPRVRIELSWRLWLVAFLGTAAIYLVHADLEQPQGSPFAPWLHSSALPVFAVLAVVVAVLFRGVERWLGDYERLAADAVAFVRKLFVHSPPVAAPHVADADAPRRIHGIVFESRPPPAVA
jgi:hypothetical protein